MLTLAIWSFIICLFALIVCVLADVSRHLEKKRRIERLRERRRYLDNIEPKRWTT